MPPAVPLMTDMIIREAGNTFADFSKTGIFGGFSQYTESIGELRWAGGGEAGAAQRPILHVNEPKKEGARSAAKTHCI
jgi:hypothetical protein